jgi:hypothetical protein
LQTESSSINEEEALESTKTDKSMNSLLEPNNLPVKTGQLFTRQLLTKNPDLHSSYSNSLNQRLNNMSLMDMGSKEMKSMGSTSSAKVDGKPDKDEEPGTGSGMGSPTGPERD